METAGEIQVEILGQLLHNHVTFSFETVSFPGNDESKSSSPHRTVENIENVGEMEACSQE